MMITNAIELEESSRWCTCCGRLLIGRIRWLELNTKTGIYSEPGTVPADQSQGSFPFGVHCAKTKLESQQ